MVALIFLAIFAVVCYVMILLQGSYGSGSGNDKDDDID